MAAGRERSRRREGGWESPVAAIVADVVEAEAAGRERSSCSFRSTSVARSLSLSLKYVLDLKTVRAW